MVIRGLFQVTMAGICSSLMRLLGVLEDWKVTSFVGKPVLWREVSTFPPLYNRLRRASLGDNEARKRQVVV